MNCLVIKRSTTKLLFQLETDFITKTQIREWRIIDSNQLLNKTFVEERVHLKQHNTYSVIESISSSFCKLFLYTVGDFKTIQEDN